MRARWNGGARPWASWARRAGRAVWRRTERSLLEAVALEVAVALQNARLYHLAVEAADHDGVTGLLNHRAIIQQVSTRMKEAAATSQPLAVILIDLDNFKRINDTHGHLVGDQTLKCVSTAMLECCQEGHVAGRYGGDEFILVCPGADAAAARVLAENIKARLKASEVSRPGGGTLPVSASFGVALYPQMATSQHELLALADVNLYELKAKGTGEIIGLDEPGRRGYLLPGLLHGSRCAGHRGGQARPLHPQALGGGHRLLAYDRSRAGAHRRNDADGAGLPDCCTIWENRHPGRYPAQAGRARPTKSST